MLGLFCDGNRRLSTDLFAKPLFVALYLNFLRGKASTSAPIVEAVIALSWAHQMAVVEDPTSHPLVKQALAGCKRVLACRSRKKGNLLHQRSSIIWLKSLLNLGHQLQTFRQSLVACLALLVFSAVMKPQVYYIREADCSIIISGTHGTFS